MKKLNFLFLLIACSTVQAQIGGFHLNFEIPSNLEYLIIDTVTYPENIWQVGRPQKTVFDSASSLPNAIVTDTLNPYPVNNHSAFLLRYEADWGDVYGLKFFSGTYRVLTDSLKDFGTMEFSPDNGQTWIDLINDSAYSMNVSWYSNKPVLSGNSGDWRWYDCVLSDMGSIFNIQMGDTIFFRFSFTSDSVYDGLDGLMFDDISVYDFVEGISEVDFLPLKSVIFPNPSSDFFTIEFENPGNHPFELSVYTMSSDLVFRQNDISGNTIRLDASNYKPGIYIYKLTCQGENKRSWGKFAVTD